MGQEEQQFQHHETGSPVLLSPAGSLSVCKERTQMQGTGTGNNWKFCALPFCCLIHCRKKAVESNYRLVLHGSVRRWTNLSQGMQRAFFSTEGAMKSVPC